MSRLLGILAIAAVVWLAAQPDGSPSRAEPPSALRPYAGDDRATVGGRTYQGEELTVDLPGAFHIANVGSKVDRKGMCVDSSIEMQALALGMDEWKGFRDWAAAREGGGGWPAKVDDQVKAFAAAKGIPVPPYTQIEGGPAEIKAAIELLDRTGRGYCCTYGWGERYGKQIAHMVCGVKFNGKFAVVLDNNFVGEDAYEWMPPDEKVRRICYPSGRGWVFSWLVPAGVNRPLTNG